MAGKLLIQPSLVRPRPLYTAADKRPALAYKGAHAESIPRKKRPKKGRTKKWLPRIGFVSLGCPKALVNSERIITKLRAEGYELSPSYDGADAVVVNTCGFLNSAKEESLEAIGEALAENGKVIVTGCLGVESDRILARHPGVLAITGPQQYEAVVDEVHKAVPPAARSLRRSAAAAGRSAHAPPLRLFEDLGRLQQSPAASASYRTCAASCRAGLSAM